MEREVKEDATSTETIQEVTNGKETNTKEAAENVEETKSSMEERMVKMKELRKRMVSFLDPCPF